MVHRVSQMQRAMLRLGLALSVVVLSGCVGAAPQTPRSVVAAPTPGAAPVAPGTARLDPETEAAIEAAIAEYDRQLAAMEAKFTEPDAPDDREWVKRKLAHMVEVDQFTRNFEDRGRGLHRFHGAASEEFMRRFVPRFAAVDVANTRVMKSLTQRHGWITIDAFGEQAADDAWLLVQHADHDPAFQRDVLARMEPLLDTGAVSRKNYAYLYDRVQINAGALQRYGTQGGCEGGAWHPGPLEDPDRVDARRTSVDLPPMAEYQALFVDVCREEPPPSPR